MAGDDVSVGKEGRAERWMAVTTATGANATEPVRRLSIYNSRSHEAFELKEGRAPALGGCNDNHDH